MATSWPVIWEGGKWLSRQDLLLKQLFLTSSVEKSAGWFLRSCYVDHNGLEFFLFGTNPSSVYFQTLILSFLVLPWLHSFFFFFSSPPPRCCHGISSSISLPHLFQLKLNSDIFTLLERIIRIQHCMLDWGFSKAMRSHEKLNTFLAVLVVLFLTYTRTVQMVLVERFKLAWFIVREGRTILVNWSVSGMMSEDWFMHAKCELLLN